MTYFQPTARQPFATQPQISVLVSQQVAIKSSPEPEVPTESTNSPVVSPTQPKQVVCQLEAYVRNDAKLSANRRLATRLVRLQEVVATAPQQVPEPFRVTTKPISFVERTLLKKLDKKIRQQLAPTQPKAMTANMRLGIIIGVIGLLLLIIGSGIFTVLGIIGLLVGIVLFVLGYIDS